MIKFIYMIDEGDFMNAENKNVKKLFILILIGLVFIIGFSFAVYNIVLEGNKEHSITTSKISFSYKEQVDNYNFLAYGSLTNDDGKIMDDYYEFTVKAIADGPTVINYVVYLQRIETDYDYPDDAIKAYLTTVSSGTEVQNFAPTLVSGLDDYLGSYKYLTQGIFTFENEDGGELSQTFRLRLWIKDGYDINSLFTNTKEDNGEQHIVLENYSYKFKVNVETIA